MKDQYLFGMYLYLERLWGDRPRIYNDNTSDSVGESLPRKPNILDIKLGAV